MDIVKQDCLHFRVPFKGFSAYPAKCTAKLEDKPNPLDSSIALPQFSRYIKGVRVITVYHYCIIFIFTSYYV